MKVADLVRDLHDRGIPLAAIEDKRLHAEEDLGGAGVEVIYAVLQRRAAVYTPDVGDCLLCGGGGVYSPFAGERSLCAHCAATHVSSEALRASELLEAAYIPCSRSGVLVGTTALDGRMANVCADCRREHAHR
jgi:hypothetical protein